MGEARAHGSVPPPPPDGAPAMNDAPPIGVSTNWYTRVIKVGPSEEDKTRRWHLWVLGFHWWWRSVRRHPLRGCGSPRLQSADLVRAARIATGGVSRTVRVLGLFRRPFHPEPIRGNGNASEPTRYHLQLVSR